MNALVFLNKKVLKNPFDEEINAVRANKKIHVPVVMTREETSKVIKMMEGTTQIAAKLMYGSGLRIMQNHLAKVKAIHEPDLEKRYGEVYMPYPLARRYPNAAREWGWQYVFPARNLSTAPRSGVVRRHHIDPSVINKAIKVAVRKADLTKRISAHIQPTSRQDPPIHTGQWPPWSWPLSQTAGSCFRG